MKTIHRVFTTISIYLFEYWIIFFIYLALYLTFWTFGLETKQLAIIFKDLHLVFLAFFIVYLLHKKNNIQQGILIGFAALFIILVAIGAYLEYPSDPWEHFRRIFIWQNFGLIESYEFDVKNKFAYFWAWTFLIDTPLLSRRQALDILSAFWQWALCIQVYRFVRRLGFDTAWSLIHVFSFFSLFGTSIFGIRYYALSSTPLAYIAYLQALILLLDVLEHREIKKAFFFPIYFLLMIFNHEQELLFFLVSGAALTFYYLYLRASDARRLVFRRVCLVVLILGFVFGVVAQKLLLPTSLHLEPNQLSFFGSLRIWDHKLKYYMDAIAIHGWIAFVFAIIFFKRYPIVSLLTLMPFALLLFPPSAILFSQIVPKPHLTYRIFYAFPLSLMLIIGIKELIYVAGIYFTPIHWKKYSYTIAFVLVLLFSVPVQKPWAGKLYFQLYQSWRDRSLQTLDQTALWFRNYRAKKDLRYCLTIGDDATKTVVLAHLGAESKFFGGDSTRKAKRMDTWYLHNKDEFLKFTESDEPFCGVLAGIAELVPESSPSFAAETSAHWREYRGRLTWNINNDAFIKAADSLTEIGWEKTAVPPFYNFYEAPTD